MKGEDIACQRRSAEASIPSFCHGHIGFVVSEQMLNATLFGESLNLSCS